MEKKSKDQISSWLSKLEQESWQLELLVSGFTIFLLFKGSVALTEYHQHFNYEFYTFNNLPAFLNVLIAVLRFSVYILIISLVTHLLLRGFWIGAIGLRSVQSGISYKKLKYSKFFTQKLETKNISLDQLIVNLDSICSVIFSFTFLLVAQLLAFGLYSVAVGLINAFFEFLISISGESFHPVIRAFQIGNVLFFLVTGIIYFIDYFSLGFFKKIRWLSKVYYPLYRMYGFITLAGMSKSIYYSLIVKFSKKKIRIALLLVLGFVFLSVSTSLDQHTYFPNNSSDEYFWTDNYYDDERPGEVFITKASIPSRIISGDYLRLFIAYRPSDNNTIAKICPDFIPVKEEGLSFNIKAKDGNLSVGPSVNSEPNPQKALDCLCSIFQVEINDSTYDHLDFKFYRHPNNDERGIVTMVPTGGFKHRANVIRIRKMNYIKEADSLTQDTKYAVIPFWTE